MPGVASASLPPGLPWHSLRQTYAWIRHPQETADRCLREYGDVFTLRMFGTDYVLHASPDLMRELLSHPADVLAAGSANALVAPLVGSTSLLVLDGEEHLAMRRMMLPPLHGDRMRSYEQTMREVSEKSIARWPLEDAFPTWTRMQSITLDVIIRVVFGIEDGRRAHDVRNAVRTLLKTGTDRRLLMRVGLRSALTGRPPTEHDRVLRKVTRARADVGRLIDAEISRRRAGHGGEDRPDVLAMLIDARTPEGEPLPTSLIRDQLVTLLVAGHETTATALSWAVERIARHPELQERLAAEALDGRYELIDATIKETLRARPVLPIFMREVLKPVTIGDYTYEPGQLVGGASIALHRRPDLYPDPDEFRPERFLGDQAPGTYEWTPFGGSVRRCIGASFAMLEMRIVLAALLAERRLEPVDERPEPVRRRSIVLAPGHGAEVRAPRRRSARPAPVDAQHSHGRGGAAGARRSCSQRPRWSRRASRDVAAGRRRTMGPGPPVSRRTAMRRRSHRSRSAPRSSSPRSPRHRATSPHRPRPRRPATTRRRSVRPRRSCARRSRQRRSRSSTARSCGSTRQRLIAWISSPGASVRRRASRSSRRARRNSAPRSSAIRRRKSRCARRFSARSLRRRRRRRRRPRRPGTVRRHRPPRRRPRPTERSSAGQARRWAAWVAGGRGASGAASSASASNSASVSG
jgi:cytochrome P450